jgi:hypothetical protein
VLNYHHHHFPYSCAFALEKFSLYSSCERNHLDVPFFQAYRGLKPCTSLLENVSLRAPARSVRDFLKFSVCPSNKHCPSARCAYSANVLDKDLDIFAIGAIYLNHILQFSAYNC